MKYKAKQEEKNYMGGVAAAEEDDWYSGMAKSKQQFKDPYNQPPPQVVAPPKTVPQSTYNEDPIEVWNIEYIYIYICVCRLSLIIYRMRNM